MRGGIKIFKGVEKLKKVLLIVGAIILATNIVGCIGPSDRKIESMFNDFIEIFPSENLEFLYDKEGEVSSVDGKTKLNMNDEGLQVTGLDLEDKGTWRISSYLYTEQSAKGIGVSLGFNRNTRKATGEFIFRDNGNSTEYPIYYNKGKLYLADEENTPNDVKEKLADFKMMYEFIDLDRKYLDNLKSTKIMYNPEVQIFDAYYKLDSDDKNIKKIKELHPDLVVDVENCEFEFHGMGIPWNTVGRLSLEINLDEKRNTYFTTSMTFQSSELR